MKVMVWLGNSSVVKIYIIRPNSVVEHWSSNPEDAGSIPKPEGLGVAFFATGPGLGLITYILTTIQ